MAPFTTPPFAFPRAVLAAVIAVLIFAGGGATVARGAGAQTTTIGFDDLASGTAIGGGGLLGHPSGSKCRLIHKSFYLLTDLPTLIAGVTLWARCHYSKAMRHRRGVSTRFPLENRR